MIFQPSMESISDLNDHGHMIVLLPFQKRYELVQFGIRAFKVHFGVYAEFKTLDSRPMTRFCRRDCDRELISDGSGPEVIGIFMARVPLDFISASVLGCLPSGRAIWVVVDPGRGSLSFLSTLCNSTSILISTSSVS